MKFTKIEDIYALENLSFAKKARINALTRIIEQVRARYSEMTDSQLAEALRDVRGMQREIDDAKKWCDEADAGIKAFYKPAMVID